MLHFYFYFGGARMTVKDYKIFNTIADGVRRVVIRDNTTKITGIMEEKYKIIAEQNARISSMDDITEVHCIGCINDIYYILVLFDKDAADKIGVFWPDPFSTIIGDYSSGNYSDVYIFYATTEIFDSLKVSYNLANAIAYDACDGTTSYNYYDELSRMYCFFNKFRGIYTEDDINSIFEGLNTPNSYSEIVIRLLDTYGYSSTFIPDAACIAEIQKVVRLEAKKSENTGKETE